MVKNNNVNVIRKNKFVKHTVNGLFRFVILWIIKYNGQIHGYSIMKKLDLFFENLIEDGAVKESTPSKVYPILKDMEDYGLIKGFSKAKGNKKITYYQITDEGVMFLDYLFETFLLHEKNPNWKLLFDDLSSE